MAIAVLKSSLSVSARLAIGKAGRRTNWARVATPRTYGPPLFRFSALAGGAGRRRLVLEPDLSNLGDCLGQAQERSAAPRFVEVNRVADAAVEIGDVARGVREDALAG